MSASRPLSSEPEAPSLQSRIRSRSVELDGEQVGVDLVDAVERLEDQVAVGVGPGVLLGDPALVDQALHEGVVAGELADLAGRGRGRRGCRRRGPSPGASPSNSATVAVVLVPLRDGLLVDEVADPVGGAVQGAVDELEPGLSSSASPGGCVEQAQLADGGAGGEVAAGGAADAVADGEQPGPGVAGVLVVLAYAPDVGDRGVLQSERHFRSSRMVLPMRTWVPRASVVGWVIRALPM